MLSRDKMRFKGTGTSQGLQGRDSSLMTFTFSVFRERDNLLWDEKHGKEKKKKKKKNRMARRDGRKRPCLCLITLDTLKENVWGKNMAKEGIETFKERIWLIVLSPRKFFKFDKRCFDSSCHTHLTWFDSIDW